MTVKLNKVAFDHAALILHERPTPLQLLGCALIRVGSYCATQRLPRLRRRSR